MYSVCVLYVFNAAASSAEIVLDADLNKLGFLACEQYMTYNLL